MSVNNSIRLIIVCFLFMCILKTTNAEYLNIQGFLDTKLIDAESNGTDTINELAIKINPYYENFGVNIISRFFDKKGYDTEFSAYYDGEINKIYIGNTAGANNIIKLYNNEVDFIFSNKTKYNNCITMPKPLIDQNLGHITNMQDFYKNKYANKITYSLNNIKNFTFALSYSDNIELENYSKIGNVLEYGVRYDNFYNNIYYSFNFLGQNNNGSSKYNINSYETGGYLSYLGISLSFSYGFGSENTINNKDFYYTNTNLSYELKKLNASLNYFRSKKDFGYEFNLFSFNTNYKINKYIKPYFQYDLVNTKSEENVFTIGLLFNIEL